MGSLKELDPVALLTDLPELGLVRGQLGTALLDLGGGAWEVEFDDNQGRTYRQAALKEDQLLVLRTAPVPA
jgi:hypothetical protein